MALNPRVIRGVFLSVSFLMAFHQYFVRGVVYDAVVYGVVTPTMLALLSVLRSLTGRGNREWLASASGFALLILVSNVPGTLGLHDAGIQYDRYLHLVVGFCSFPLAVLILLPMNVRRPMLLAFGSVFVGLFAFELNQWFWDQAVGTRLFYDVRQHINRDFWEDIAFGFAGLMLAVTWVRARLPAFVRAARARSS